MAKRPANLVAYAEALLGFPINVGSPVITTTDNTGGDNDDKEQTVPAGAKAEVMHITWYGGDTRLSVTLLIPVPGVDSDGDPNSITAMFDENDGDDLFPFKPDRDPSEYRNYDVSVRAVMHCTHNLRIRAASAEDAEAEGLRRAEAGELRWDISDAEDEQVESVVEVAP